MRFYTSLIYKVKLHEREINSHLQVCRRLLGLMFIVGEVLYLAYL
ncbi:hypothetical protein PPAR_a2686 [Pseudoalteromonas paragorgicola KMM 3548]|nr:hypothetical protein [Pseudoalteromonas distincta KMM 3548]